MLPLSLPKGWREGRVSPISPHSFIAAFHVQASKPDAELLQLKIRPSLRGFPGSFPTFPRVSPVPPFPREVSQFPRQHCFPPCRDRPSPSNHASSCLCVCITHQLHPYGIGTSHITAPRMGLGWTSVLQGLSPKVHLVDLQALGGVCRDLRGALENVPEASWLMAARCAANPLRRILPVVLPSADSAGMQKSTPRGASSVSELYCQQCTPACRPLGSPACCPERWQSSSSLLGCNTPWRELHQRAAARAQPRR